MLQTALPVILKLSLFFVTAVATHLVMSFGQTLLHYKVGHHPIGGKLFRNHINFHHSHYADDHLVSPTVVTGRLKPRRRVQWWRMLCRIRTGSGCIWCKCRTAVRGGRWTHLGRRHRQGNHRPERTRGGGDFPAVFSPDGAHLVTASLDKTARGKSGQIKI